MVPFLISWFPATLCSTTRPSPINSLFNPKSSKSLMILSFVNPFKSGIITVSVFPLLPPAYRIISLPSLRVNPGFGFISVIVPPLPSTLIVNPASVNY